MAISRRIGAASVKRECIRQAVQVQRRMHRRPLVVFLRATALVLVLIGLTSGETLATGTQFEASAKNGTASFEIQLVGREDPGYPQIHYEGPGAYSEEGDAKFDMAKVDIRMIRARKQLTVTYRGSGKPKELPSFVLRVRGNDCTVEIRGMTLQGKAYWQTY